MRILVVDDEDALRRTLAEFLSLEGWEVHQASNGLSARKMLEEKSFNAVVLDMRMPGLDGPGLLKWLVNEGPLVPVVMMSAFGEVNDAVAAMKAGAVDYLVKPFDPEELVLRVRRAAAAGRTQNITEQSGKQRTLSVDPAMKPISELLEKAAPTDATILITGESGTGKEIAARYVHDISGRANGPFVAVNLGGLPENLVESELFGYERGAFTGADSRKPGLFETANGGTLFLDEIGEIPPSLQVKLLRALQEKKIQRLGGLGVIPVDVRIITATNRNLEEEVAKGQFREDLFYRINVIRVSIPPLRHRPEDIPWLTGIFIEKHGAGRRPDIRGLSEESLLSLTEYKFPGNIRELENMIERALILAKGPFLQPSDMALPERFVGQLPDNKSKPGTLREMEAVMIQEALHRNEGHRERTASELGITRKTLLNKINDYGIEA